MIGSLRRLTAYPMTWSSVLALSILLSSAAAAQNVNSNLCGTNSKNGTERILSPAQTKELVRYVDGLRQGSHVFNWTISGHYAADQLGFGKRFAATYGQAVEEVKLRMNRKRSVHIDEIIEYLGGALSEEQFIDGLIAEGERHFPAIVYLRALQEGDCAFPYVLRDTPSAQAMLNQLAQAYPEVKKKKGFASEPFLDIYDRAVAYGRDRIKQDGSVSIYRLIEEWRRAIVQSAKGTTSSNVAAAPSVSPPKPPVEKSSGSGFFVTQAGHLLTNAHVVGDCTTIHVKSSDGQTGVAKVIAADQNNDLALLRLERRIEMIAAFRTGRPTRPGESAVVFGFPLSQLLSSTGNATIGIVSALAGLRDAPNQIQISAPVQSGSSGGPVLDASGQLIGVVVSKLNAVRGDVPQNVNFAIKASTAAKFLDAHGIAYRSATSEKALAIPDIVEQARGFSVQVLCQG
jgi:S1-C subfamily serine protease